MSEPCQNPAYDAATVVGPDDLLLLVSKEPLSSVDAADLQRRMPELARGRLVVVDGTFFDAYVLSAGKSASSGSCSSCGGLIPTACDGECGADWFPVMPSSRKVGGGHDE